MLHRFTLRAPVFLTLAPMLFFVVCSAHSAQDAQAGWNGILPLHSIRKDVENLLGSPTTECRCVYSTAIETIAVDYSAGPCKGPPHGWNVPAGTVLGITVSPKQESVISEAELLAQNYISSRAIDGPIVYYTNLRRGIRYAVSGGKINSVFYIPTGNDLSLRCLGFPPYDGGQREYHPYAAFSTKAQFINERLGEFAAQLVHNTSVKGYVVTYGGQIATKDEARTMADNAKKRLTEMHHVAADRIITINGGFRETAEYELFLIPNDMPPPSPTPTIAANEVQIVKGTKRNKGRSKRR